MIGPKISHDPGFKMGHDRVLNPPESGFSHELPGNDKGTNEWGPVEFRRSARSIRAKIS